jgi:hypothetical protein
VSRRFKSMLRPLGPRVGGIGPCGARKRGQGKGRARPTLWRQD